MKTAADGTTPLTIVPGTSPTGLFAADGTMNAVFAPGTRPVGVYHPCGAAYVTLGSGPGNYAPDGSLYAMVSGAGYALLRSGGVAGPTAPVLIITSPSTQANPAFTIDFDNTVAAGDNLRLQVQVSGGDWSTPVSDTNHVITAPEDTANEVLLALSALGNANYQARANVTHGATSGWSNIVSFTIAVVSAPSVSFVAASLGSTASATVTVASANIGNPAYIATRRVIVFIVGGSHGNTLVQGSCLINGVTPDTVSPAIGAAGTGVDGAWIMSAVVPTGTTGVSVSAVFSGNMFGNIVFAIYNVDNTLLNSPIPVTGFTEVLATTTGTVTANSLAGGFILTGEAATSGVGSGFSVSAASETYVLDQTGIAGSNSIAHANSVSANTPSSVTWSWTGSPTSVGIAIAAFR